MFADADHEVIDSPEALFRHLYEEHGVEEARDLDPETAPVQFWLRRHHELERAERADRHRDEPVPDPPARPREEGPSPGGGWEEGAGSPGRPREEAGRPAARPRAKTRSQPGQRSRPAPGRGPNAGAAAAREGRRPAGFGDPLVEAVARALAGRGQDEAAVRAAIRSFAGADGQPAGEAAVRAVFVEPMLESVAERLLGAGDPATPPDPSPAAPRGEEPARPETAWAVLWADLAETRRPGGGDRGPAGGDADDLMAVADAVQRRRRARRLRR